jgi:hypothetical protein
MQQMTFRQNWSDDLVGGTGKEDGPILASSTLEFQRGAGVLFTIQEQKLTQSSSQVRAWIRANDPSAGSPTETLLRLLLPLSDKVH